MARFTIERRVPLLATGLVLFVAVVLALAAYSEVATLAAGTAQDRVTRRAHDVADIVSRSLAARVRQLDSAARDTALVRFVRTSGQQGNAATLEALRRFGSITATRAVSILDPTGHVLLSTDSTRRSLPGIEDARPVAGITRLYVMDSVLAYRIARPIAVGTGAPAWLVERTRVSSTRQARQTLLQLMGSDAHLLYGNAAGDVWSDLSGNLPGPTGHWEPEQPFTYQTPRDGAVLAALVPVAGSPWVMLVGLRERDIGAPVRAFVRDLALVAVLLVLVGIAVALRVSRTITAPLRRVGEAANAFAAGDLATRAPVAGNDEVADLARAFNVMADRVATRGAADERYRMVGQATNDVIWDWDVVSRHVWWSENATSVLGDAPRESGSDPLSVARAHPDDRDRVQRQLQAALEAGGRALACEYRFGLADGSYVHVLVRGFALRDAAGNAVRMIGSLTDVSDRVHAERRYHDIFTRAPVGIYQSSRDGRVLDANPALARMLGYASPDELFALHMERDIYWEPGTRERLIATAASSPVPDVDVEAQWRRRDGTPMWVQLAVQRHRGADGQVLYFEGFVRDITDRKRLEDQLRQSQKMEAVGQLAGGVAHDFNNLLTAITGYAELLYDDMGEDDARRSDVTEIRQAAGRAAQLTRQLLAFSRKQVLQPRALDLNGVVGNIERMLSRLLGETVTLRTKLSASLGTVRADPGQIEQVLMNLAVNAGDAMPKGGELTIETNEVELDAEYAREHVDAVPGRYVMLAVHDTGVGMAPATQARLFEPFFTTKGLGKGTGLGLSTVYGIVKQSGGHVWVYSEVGRGTTFKVYLPRIDVPADITPPSEARAPTGGTETVLVVEDADLLRALARRVLEGFGYTVLLASGGEEALTVADAHQGRIHLLLTDVVMPEVGGAELAKRLAARRPDVAVLFMSGYTDDAIVRHGVLDEGVAFIQKPFTAETLVRRVREVLDASGATDHVAGATARPAS